MSLTLQDARDLARARREIRPILRRLKPALQGTLLEALGLDVVDAVDESEVVDRGATVVRSDTKLVPAIQKRPAPIPTTGSHVRRVLREATQWLTTTEIVAEVRRVEPDVDPKRVYATINKMANKSKTPLARRGQPPSIEYATRELAAAWEARDRKSARHATKPLSYVPTAGDLVRKTFAEATQWLTTSEVLAQVCKADPEVQPKQVWGAINKASTSGKLARSGKHPGIRYATREHAATWGEPTRHEHLNGSTEKRSSSA